MNTNQVFLSYLYLYSKVGTDDLININHDDTRAQICGKNTDLISIRHDDSVVLGAHIALDSLAVHAAPLVDMSAGSVAANKGNSSKYECFITRMTTFVIEKLNKSGNQTNE